MRLARLAAAAAVCVTLALVAAAGASADPVNAPGAESITFVCGGVPITLTVLPNNASAAFTLSTSVGIAVGAVITNAATGEVLFSYSIPGFAKNAVETTTCVVTIGAQQFAVTAFFTPARK